MQNYLVKFLWKNYEFVAFGDNKNTIDRCISDVVETVTKSSRSLGQRVCFVMELFIWRNKGWYYFICDFSFFFFFFICRHRREEDSFTAVAVQTNRDLGRHVVQNFVHAIRAEEQKARCSPERVRLMVMNFREARPPGWFHNARAMPLLSLAWPTSADLSLPRSYRSLSSFLSPRPQQLVVRAVERTHGKRIVRLRNKKKKEKEKKRKARSKEQARAN